MAIINSKQVYPITSALLRYKQYSEDLMELQKTAGLLEYQQEQGIYVAKDLEYTYSLINSTEVLLKHEKTVLGIYGIELVD